MRILLSTLCLFMANCAYNEELMVRADGLQYRNRNLWLGGDHMQETSAGTKSASTLTASFRDAITGATAIAAAHYGAAASASKEATAQVASKEATKQTVNASNNATAVELGAQEVQKTALGMEATAIPK